MIQTLKYKPHQFAKLVPEPSAAEQEELTNDIKENGLHEPIVLFEGQVLDGRSRQKALTQLGIKDFPTEDFDPKIDGDPLAFVVSKNFKRRQLQMTASQKAAYVAEHILPLFEAREPDSPPVGGNGKGVEHEPVTTKSKRSVAAAAAKSGVSPRSLERAKRIREKDPAKLKEVTAGKKTLNKAERELSAKERDARDRTEALARIEKVLGKDSDFSRAHTGIPQMLRKTRPLVQFSKLDKEEMKKALGLILIGWTLNRAIQFNNSRKVTLQSKLQFLLWKAAAEGWKLKAEIDGWTVEIYRSKK